MRTFATFNAALCLLGLLAAGIIASPPAIAAAKPSIQREAEVRQTPEQHYSALKNKLTSLNSGTTRASNSREQWLSLAQSFFQLHLSQKKEVLGPNSLFMTAHVYRIMHQRFHLEEDARNARLRYLQLTDLYPGHALADDALFEAAGLTTSINDQSPSAHSLYEQIVAQYPLGDQLTKAGKMLAAHPFPPPEAPATTKETLATVQSPPSPAAASPPPAQPLSASTANDYSRLKPAKFWSSQQYSRIVVESNTAVPFVVRKVSDQPAQLLLELQQSTLDPQFCHPQILDHGMLQQIHSTQPNKGVVRFLLDLEPYVEYKVFSLQDPFRVVVDIYGKPDEKKIPSTPEVMARQPSDPVPVVPTQAARTALTAWEVPVLNEQKKVKETDGSPTQSKRKQEQISLAQQLGLGVKTIVIDPGHGGKDPGAMAFGLKEKEIVLKVAQKLAKILKDTSRYQVMLTRTKDVFIPLEKRTAQANAQKADLFISIHVNAHADQSSSGIETYFLNLATDADAMRVAALENASSNHSIGELQDILSSLMNNSKIDESSRLARFVQNNLINGLQTAYKPRDLGVKQAPFYVLIGAEMPAILAELSFITNPAEAKMLQDEAHLERLAKQLAGGIIAYIDHHHTAARLH